MRPDARNQFSEPHPPGYRFEAEDCWSTVGAWLRDGATGGKAKPNNSGVIRNSAGQATGPGPGNLSSIDRALTALSVHFNRRLLTRADARSLLTSNKDIFIALPTDFSSWPQRKRCQPDFTGLHMVGIIPGLGGQGQQVLVMNPLCGDYEWVNIEAVLDSAVEYTRQDTGKRGMVVLGVVRPPATPPPPPPPPPPAETPEQAVKRLTKERDAALLERDAARELLQTAEDQIDGWVSYRETIRTAPSPGEAP